MTGLFASAFPAVGHNFGVRGSDQLDLISTLPVHPIAVSVAVVLLPLSSLLLVLVVLIPKLRRAIGWLVVLLLGAAAGISWVAQESGAALAARLGRPEDHSNLGELVLWFTAAQFVVGLVWFVLARVGQSRKAKAATSSASAPPATGSASTSDPYGGLTGGVDPITGKPFAGGEPAPARPASAASPTTSPVTVVFGIAAIVVAGMNLFLVLRVGQTGMEATWAARVAAAASPTPTPELTQSPTASPTPEFSELTSPSELTQSPITSASPEVGVSGQANGSASPSATPTSQVSTSPAIDTGMPSYTEGEVAVHNRAESCWVLVEGRVYDLTGWLPTHQGTAATLEELCGTDATSSLSSASGSPLIPAQDLVRLQIGVLG